MATPAFLVRLMDYASLSRSLKIGPEDKGALAFATELRAATLEGRLSAVWTHPANELAGITRMTKNGPRAMPQAALARALGLIRGSSDYLFLWDDGAGAIEFKSSTGSMTPSQRDFRDWCEVKGVRFATARSCAAGLETLRGWGVLT